MPGHIILVGPMGVGKTTIGRMLAQHLEIPFIDIDHLVVDRAGADIPWIFDVEGEAGFRKREHQALQDTLNDKAAVIATGGGIVTLPENRDLLEGEDCVVYLKAGIKKLLERTARDKNRPLLQNDDPEKVLRQLMQEREPYYQQLADLVISTDQKKPGAVIKAIERYWQKPL